MWRSVTPLITSFLCVLPLLSCNDVGIGGPDNGPMFSNPDIESMGYEGCTNLQCRQVVCKNAKRRPLLGESTSQPATCRSRGLCLCSQRRAKSHHHGAIVRALRHAVFRRAGRQDPDRSERRVHPRQRTNWRERAAGRAGRQVAARVQRQLR